MDPSNIECYVKAKAPVNIAVIKYWGKSDESLKIPINDSLSGTLSIDDLCTTTAVYLSRDFKHDELVLNGQKHNLTITEKSPASVMLRDFRALAKPSDPGNATPKVRIVSENNFPTAAGLASSAAGYACLAYALGHAFGFTDSLLLSRIARKASGSACRSLFGGFVHWVKGDDDATSYAKQVVDHHHWPQMRVIICVVNDDKKDTSSSNGMARSVATSDLIHFRAEQIVPKRINAIKDAIIKRDFETFARLTMQDSNQFHSVCLDTYEPIFYLNETSRQIIKICSIINEFYGHNKVAYTFDAGPNACVYLLEDYVPEFIEVMRHYCSDSELRIDGIRHNPVEPNSRLIDRIRSELTMIAASIKYLINTSLGGGPELVEIKSNVK